MKYNKPFDQTDLDAPYVNGDPVVGRKGSIPPAEAMEFPQREIVHVIEAAGIIPSNTDLYQLLKAIKFFGGNIKQGVDVGTKNAVQVTLDPAVTSYDKLFCMVQKMATSNDAAMTFTANGMPTKNLKDATGAPLSTGALLGSTAFLAIYDGTQMRVLGGATTYNSITGLTANGGEVIDVTSSGGTTTIAVNYDKPAHNTAFDPDDILVRKIHGGGAHVKFTLQELLDWVSGHITFPAGEDPIYLQSGIYKVKRATTTQVGVVRKATPAEVIARVAVAGNPYVGPEDLPTVDPWGIGIGAIVTVPCVESAGAGTNVVGMTVSASALVAGTNVFSGSVTNLFTGACVPPGSSLSVIGSGFSNTWSDARRSTFTGTWTVVNQMMGITDLASSSGVHGHLVLKRTA